MRILKWLLGIIAILFLGLFILFKASSESMPEGTTGPAADALANKVLAAIDKPAWDTTGVVQWTFRGAHDFLWDKKRNLVKVNWDDNEALVTLDETTGKAWKNGVEVTGDEGDKLVKAAWAHFCNDSFWLNAPAKVFDPGTERSIVDMPDGSKGLMITYKSGGVTPGTLSTGAKIATNHASKVLGIDITNLKAANNLSDFGLSNDPFQPIL